MSLPAKPFLQYYNLTISTLSPVHIGCGEDYEPTNYVMDNQCLHFFDLAEFSDFVTDDDHKELNQINQDRDPLLRLQKFIATRKDRLLLLSTLFRPVALDLFNKYQKVVGKAANIEQSGKKVINALEIARTAFNSHSQEPILPGSSIKGSIRTALLNNINSGKPTTLQGNEFRKLEWDLLQGRFETDPLRLVKVGDGHFQNHNNVLFPRVIFENNIKRNPPKTGKGTRLPLSLMREVIPEFNHAVFTADISIQDLLNTKSDKIPSQQFSMNKIVQACNEFYGGIFTKEQARFRHRGCLQMAWDQHASEILNLIQPFISTNKGMLMRIGRHSGAESVTLDGVRSIKIMQGPESPRYESQATTDWLACDQEKSEINLIPFGWIFVDLNHPDMESHRATLKTYLHTAGLSLYDSQRKMFETVDTRRKQLKDEQLQLIKREKDKKEQFDAEQQAKVARQQALAAMSSEQREIEVFREMLEMSKSKGQYNASDSVFNEQRLKLFKASVEWSDANARQQAAILLQDSIKWSGWPGKKERKAQFKEWMKLLEAIS